MNGFSLSQLPHEVAQGLVMDLVVQAEQEFAFERKIIEHPSIPLLHKFFYKKNFGTDHQDIYSQKVQGCDKLSGAAEKMDAALSSSSLALPSCATVPAVKVENKHLEEVKAMLGTMRKHKVQLEKMLCDGQDLLTELQIQNDLDAGKSKERMTRQITSCDSCEDLLTRLRMNLYLYEKLGPESFCAEVVSQVEQLKICAEAHIDGMKRLNKISKSYLEA